MTRRFGLALHGYWRSSCSWRVRIGLHWKAATFETLPVHLLRQGGEQYADTYRQLNPLRQVPTLLIDGEPLGQSLAILELLEELFPDPPLLPREPLARARVRQMAEVVNSGIQPLQNLSVMKRLGELGLDQDTVRGWCAGWIARGLEGLETLAVGYAGRYSFGDAVSLADVCLVPQLGNARRFSVDLSPFPILNRIERALLELPAFHDTRPEAQIDAES